MADSIDEHTPLMQNANGQPLRKDDRKWISWPAEALYLAWATLKSNYVNLLIVFVPLGILFGAMEWDPIATFILNFLAIVPLASLLSFATEELSAKFGQTLGGLLNATFGNAVELIVSIVALTQNKVRIVQSSMLGSILSNTLLVLGCCFLAGGVHRDEQEFNPTVASTMSSLMAVASASLIIPATLYAVMSNADDQDGKIMELSRGTSVILLILYVLYLVFQLKTHSHLFEEPAAANDSENGEAGEAHDGEEPQILGPWAAGIALVVVTVLVSICAEYLVGSIEFITATGKVSETFIGLILIPIVGNAAEHVTAVIVSYKNKMDLALGVALGSSMQIALFVTPFLVILGWIIGVDMNLRFETFETVVFFISVLIVNYLLQDGKSNYLEGCMCLGTYIIIAIAFYVYPDNAVETPHLSVGPSTVFA